jgi:LmbE family N-acetylglucosaminyl deacetylase
VVSPHPDDESIGCGGALRRHVVEGDEVQVVFLTSGEQGGHGTPPEETARVREREASDAARILGVASIEFWREPDGALCERPELAARLAQALEERRTDVVYVPHADDGHDDHRAASRVVAQAAAAARQRLGSAIEVLGFEVWTPVPRIDHIVDITAHIDAKTAAIRAYASQCAVLAFDEAARGLARWRGEMHCWPQGEYAEAFVRIGDCSATG